MRTTQPGKNFVCSYYEIFIKSKLKEFEMKNIMMLIALSFALILTACSNTEQDIISPNTSQVEKSSIGVQIFPYELYKTFPELKSAVVTWQNEKEGITIVVSDRSAGISNKYIFAVIKFVDNKGSAMAFLGDLKTGKYYLNGFNAEKISTISIFYDDITRSAGEYALPYTQSQLFNNIGVKGWADGGAYVKVSSYPFNSRTEHLFAQLIASEVNQLVFIGKPESESFDFPKSEKLNLKDIKLFTFQK
jgi:hypothetical protein